MDLLLSRYGYISSVMAMDFEDGIELINKAGEKSLEDKMFLRWIPYQESIGFFDFKNGLLSSSKKESKDEILDKVKKILELKVGE
jgi:hypothetical protein